MSERKNVVSPWVLGGIAVVALVAYGVHFGSEIWSGDQAAWGQVGDFMGGILNPLVAFGAFLWLVESVRVQKTELSETKEALKKSQEAQQQQANTALHASRIQALTVELSTITSRAQHVRAQQLYLVELQNRADGPTAYQTAYGTRQNIMIELTLLSDSAVSLQKEEDRIIGEINELATK